MFQGFNQDFLVIDLWKIENEYRQLCAREVGAD